MPEVINVKILHLVVKKKWYEMQESGEKPEEYREITPYWCKRFLGFDSAFSPLDSFHFEPFELTYESRDDWQQKPSLQDIDKQQHPEKYQAE